MERGGVKIQDERGALFDCLFDGPRLPDVFTDGYADALSSCLKNTGGITWDEVTLLIEYAIIGEKALPIMMLDSAVHDDGCGIIGSLCSFFGVTHDDHNALGGPADVFKATGYGGHEVLSKQKILWWIARKAEFGKDDDRSVEVVSGVDGCLDDAFGVPKDVSNGKIHLR